MEIPLSELIEVYGVRPQGVVHVGAHEAQELESYNEFGVSDVIWIEANPSIFARLSERIARYPNHRAYRFAAHESDGGSVELKVMSNTLSSSILEPKRHLELYPENVVTEKISVLTRTLDRFFREENVDLRRFNFLNMDIQGAELLALKGAKEHLKFFDYIYLEVNDDYLFDGCCLTPELDDFLGGHGFRRSVTRMRQDGWGDALYVSGKAPEAT